MHEARRFEICFSLIATAIPAISGCYDDIGVDNHACDVCRPCETCVVQNGRAFCAAIGGRELKCGEDGHIHSFDSCDADEGIAESCRSGQSTCGYDNDANPSCVCVNQWQGNNCDECPDHWDEAASCDECLPNWDKAEQCLACLGNWDIDEDCLKCIGNWDPLHNCSECRNNWLDDSDNCGTCPGNWDAQSDCAACQHHWEDSGDNCGTCPGNWDEAKECSDCKGHWDATTECEVCKPHWVDEGNDCNTCAPGWTGPDCNTCVRHVDLDSSADSPDGLRWETAYATVQSGIDAAATAGVGTCEVWVRKGRYYIFKESRLDTVLLKPRTELYGGFDGAESARDERDPTGNKTILDGYDAFSAGDQVNHVVTGSNDAIIDGFTITGGNAAGTSGAEDNGGGMLIYEASPTVRNCLFVDNASRGSGGAVWIYDGAPSFSDCRFVDNSSGGDGGAVSSAYDSLTMTGCYFESNSADAGGAIQCGMGGDFTTQKLTIEYCTFLNNHAQDGGALSSDDHVNVTHSIFHENQASRWGGAVDGRYLGVYRSLFVGNSAERGGAIYTGDATVVNATITGNSASEEAGAVYTTSENSFTELHNTIVWDNGGNQIGSFESYLIRVTYSLISGNDGVGNIAADPLFTLEEGFPYHLSANSPCIDAADGENAVTPDLDGFPMIDVPDIVNTGYGVPRYVDIGAYEFQPDAL